MPRFIVLIALTVLVSQSNSAFAEWVKFGDADDSTYYMDLDTIRRKGHQVKLWILIDYKTVQIKAGVSFLSTKVQKEYDCPEEQTRLLAFVRMLGNMGNGTAAQVETVPSGWLPVVPGTADEILWKTACDR